MKLLQKRIGLLCALLLFLFSMAGCQKKVTKAECPFTTITWDNTLEDIKELEGEPTETYASTYDGVTYVFEKEYEGMDGKVKYMFDDKEKLVSLAWLYETDDSEDLKNVYEKIHSETEKKLGESGFEYDSEKFSEAGTPGDVWYLEGGNVTTTMVDLSDLKVFQYQFLHPDVSQKEIG